MGQGHERTVRRVAAIGGPVLVASAASVVVTRLRGRRRSGSVTVPARERPASAHELLEELVNELRTPVASIGASSRALTPTALDAESRQEALDLVQQHTAHLAAVLEDVRQLGAELRRVHRAAPALAEAAQGAPAATRRAERVDLHALLETAADAAGLPRWRLSIEVSDDAALLVTDPEHLRRLATDLLENTVRHGPARGIVAVRGRVRDGDLLLSFTDAGRGPARLEARRLPAARRRGAGHGIGLVVVERLARALGGSLRLERRGGARSAELTPPGRRARHIVGG